MRGPNVVFVMADDLGYGDLSAFNGGLSRTPTLDDLVAGGTTLTHHYSASPVCAPARASFLTGRYPHRTGAVDTLEARGLDRIALGERTIADALKRAGYATGLVGKWHNGAFDDRYHPNRRGFDEFAGFSGGWSDYWTWRLDRNGTIAPSDGRYLTDVITDEALTFIERHRHQPYFLFVAYSAPHYPLQVPDDDAAPFLERGDLTTAVARLYGMVAVMDRGIGRILEAIDDDTLFVFTSDNGPQFGGDGDHCTDRFNCHFRGHKLLVYEGGIRLPAIIRWPNGLEARNEVGGLVHLSDWFPTILAAAQAETPADLDDLDGVDVLPLLRGDSHAVPEQRFWQWNRYEPVPSCNAAMRDGDWKLVQPALPEAMEVDQADLATDVALKYGAAPPADINRSGPVRTLSGDPPPAKLFDLSTDPHEEHDVAAAHPDRVARMEAQLEQWFLEVTATCA